MKNLAILLVFCLTLSLGGLSYGRDVTSDDEDSDQGGGNQALTGALMGGLLGGGLGAAIGSASGNAGKGALIGAGVGAVGGTLMGASQADKEKRERAYRRQDAYPEEQVAPPEAASSNVKPKAQPSDSVKAKKRVIREYDQEGNVISEKEVKN